MIREPIDLDDQPGIAPAEVDLAAGDANVELGVRQAGGPYEGEQTLLGLGARKGWAGGAFEERAKRRSPAAPGRALEKGVQPASADQMSPLRLLDGSLELTAGHDLR